MIDSRNSGIDLPVDEPVFIDLRETNDYFASLVRESMDSNGLTEQEAVVCVINGLTGYIKQRVA